MNKFFTVVLTLVIINSALSQNLRSVNYGDLHPKHRRLSMDGSLKLKVDGRGYFQYRLRVLPTDASSDASQVAATDDTNFEYDQAYATGATASAASCAVAAGDGSCALNADKDGCVATESDPVGDDPTTCTFSAAVSGYAPASNAPATAGLGDGGSEAAPDGDSENFSQTVYSRDGSLHVNKYGYLVDDNGLLLVSQGVGSDANAKHHIHIPSRADGVIVTPTGKVLSNELGGAHFITLGHIILVRFENSEGLNIRLKMKSNCYAANEDGFALGNWCAGSELDGKDHTYYAETPVSGPGILGTPGSQGFGLIERVE